MDQQYSCYEIKGDKSACWQWSLLVYDVTKSRMDKAFSFWNNPDEYVHVEEILLVFIKQGRQFI